MGCTMTEKILAGAAGLAEVDVGDVVIADVGVLTNPDYAPWIAPMQENDRKVWDPERVVFCFDHMFQPEWMPYRAEVEHGRIRAFAREQGIPAENVFDVGRNGVSHHMPVEQGFALPGTVCIGADTQSAMMGAANCFALPMLASVDSAVLSGEIWMIVPPAVRIELTGELPYGATGKDVVYRLIADLVGRVDGHVVEFDGPGVASMSVDVRMAVANGAFQLGAITIIFPGDERLERFLDGRARGSYELVTPDADAEYAARYTYDLSGFELLVAGPHEIELVRPVAELDGTPVHAAYLGSCSSGRLSDLALAAEVLRGRHIAPGMRLVVTPVSAQTHRELERSGLIGVFLDAGATVTQPGCGGCFVSNLSPLKLVAGERCISSSVEATRGRMGSPDAEVMLASASVVAASAVAGHITDPARYLTHQEVSA